MSILKFIYRGVRFKSPPPLSHFGHLTRGASDETGDATGDATSDAIGDATVDATSDETSDATGEATSWGLMDSKSKEPKKTSILKIRR